VIEQHEFAFAFGEALRMRRHSSPFLRSLGWYRKGLTTDDPFDKFLAFWNSIAIVASKYYRTVSTIDKERAKKGSINQVWECFTALWGPNEDWPVINGRPDWIDQTYAVRVGVAHGTEPVDINKVAEVAQRIPAIESVSYRFLKDWRARFLDLDWFPDSDFLQAAEWDLPPE
jgi:hypothetical protein